MDFKHRYQILFLGYSLKFQDIFKVIFPNSRFEFISWRKCNTSLLQNRIRAKTDILILCGFDYGSFTYKYKNFLNVNINNPLFLVKKFSSKKTIIFYIDTDDSIFCGKKLKKKTYSRYKFAKKQLADELIKQHEGCKIFKVPVIIENNNKIVDIKGNLFSKKIFEFLIKLKKINYITKDQLIKSIRKKLQIKGLNKLNNLKSKGLEQPRSIFFDRILRFIYD